MDVFGEINSINTILDSRIPERLCERAKTRTGPGQVKLVEVRSQLRYIVMVGILFFLSSVIPPPPVFSWFFPSFHFIPILKYDHES